MIKAIAILLTAIAVTIAVHLMPARKAPALPPPVLVLVPTPPPIEPPVPQPSPILRDTLPTIEPAPSIESPIEEPVPLPTARPKPKLPHKTVTEKPLPPSPYPCEMVRLANQMYSRAELEARAKAAGITAEQRKAALLCLK